LEEKELARGCVVTEVFLEEVTRAWRRIWRRKDISKRKLSMS
jgi:hypothetical protein